ncbi:MAG: hypothetical protein HOV67_20135 [Kribbellaceae bacterium]|nr:hypothetical protein [Kribbellaceae bacterium]
MELVLVGRRPLAEAAYLAGLGSNSLVIDATRLAFACPLDLAGIVATAHGAASDSIRVTLKLPTDPNVASYLQRMDVLRQMPSRTRIHGRVPPDARGDRRGRLMEVTALNVQTVDDMSEKVGPLVTSFYESCSDQTGAAIFRACSELMSNATEHGASTRGAFMAAQVYSGDTTDGPRLEFAVCDTGIGVMNHLRRNERYAHIRRDELAIAKALEKGVSGIGGDLRGNGLNDAVEDARSTGRIDLQIRSGLGEVRVTGSATDRRESLHDRPDQTSGTWAWLTHTLRL